MMAFNGKDTSSIHILHVDDEPEALRFSKYFLEKCDSNLNIETLTSPIEALERIKDGEYDCVISDVIMPNMDGLEFVRQIRRASDIPIVLYTCCSPDEMASDAKLAGADKYIQKMIDPTHYRKLADCIKNAVTRTTLEDSKRTRS